jgi:hypothetical protein
MILKSDDTLSIPFGYLHLARGSGENLRSIDAITVGILGLIFQFKGMYITNINELVESFGVSEEIIKDRLEWLIHNKAINADFVKNKLILTHGDYVKDITEKAYAKRASFAKKMKGSL